MQAIREIKQMFLPNEVIPRSRVIWMVGFQVVFALVVWILWPSPILPKPQGILQAFGRLWMEHGLAHELVTSFITNMEAIALATVISLGLAYLTVMPFFRPLAMAISKFRFLGLVGLTFLFTLMTGGGHLLKVSLLVFGLTVFYVTNMMQVVASIPKERFDHARTLGMSRWRVVWEVIVLGKMDEAFEALRQNAAIGWMMLTMVEGLVRSEGGVGALLLNQNKHFHLDEVFAIQITILLLGLFQDYFWGWIKRGACPWAYLGLERR